MSPLLPHLRAEGRAGAPPILFLHGIGGSSDVWAPQLAHFGRGWRALAWDMPGYGASAPVAAPGFAAWAEALDRVVATLGAKPVIVGHSLGGMILQEWLVRRPEGARAAVLSATSPAFGGKEGDFQQRFLADRLGPLDAGRSMADLAPAIVAGLMAPRAPAAARAAAEAAMAAVPPDAYRAALQALVGFDRRAALAAIRVPVLALAGAEDRTAPPAVMEKMAAKIPGATFRVLPGVGHLANLENPAVFDGAIESFAQELN